LCRYIVLCIDALGKVAGISEEFLGATVLAWGNCVGDLMSNLAVARAGQAPMAGGGHAQLEPPFSLSHFNLFDTQHHLVSNTVKPLL
jgi:hypothetical protein